jgi:lysophospholipase L1-like esterase
MGTDASTEGSGSPVAPALARVAMLLGGLLLGLVVFDLGLGRVESWRDLSEDKQLMPDVELAWTNRPGFKSARASINSLGLRGPELPAVPAPGEVRILGTGPSTTFGAGDGGPLNDQTWAAALERGIARLPGDPGDVRVLNGGVNGYSVVQAARRALLLLPQVEPDLVLVFVYPGSQALMDVSATRSSVIVDGELVPQDIVDDTPAPLLPAAIVAHRTLLDSSALYKRWRLQATDDGRRPQEIDRFVFSRAPHRPVIDSFLERTWTELSALAAGCREAGVALRAVLVPEYFMDAEKPWREYLAENAALGAPPPGTPRTEPIEALAEKLASLGIQSWSMVEALDVIGTDHAKYTGDGRHWTPAGHDVIAMSLLQNLRRESLLDALRARRAAHPRTP